MSGFGGLGVEMGINCQWAWGIVLGEYKCSKTDLWCHSVKLLKISELCMGNGWILWDVKYTAIKLLKKTPQALQVIPRLIIILDAQTQTHWPKQYFPNLTEDKHLLECLVKTKQNRFLGPKLNLLNYGHERARRSWLLIGHCLGNTEENLKPFPPMYWRDLKTFILV